MNKFDITNPEHKLLPSSIENDQGYIQFVRLKKENFNKSMAEIQEIIQSAGYKFKQLTYNQMLEVKELLKLEITDFSWDLLTGLYHTVHFFENDKNATRGSYPMSRTFAAVWTAILAKCSEDESSEQAV